MLSATPATKAVLPRRSNGLDIVGWAAARAGTLVCGSALGTVKPPTTPEHTSISRQRDIVWICPEELEEREELGSCFFWHVWEASEARLGFGATGEYEHARYAHALPGVTLQHYKFTTCSTQPLNVSNAVFQ